MPLQKQKKTPPSTLPSYGHQEIVLLGKNIITVPGIKSGARVLWWAKWQKSTQVAAADDTRSKIIGKIRFALFAIKYNLQLCSNLRCEAGYFLPCDIATEKWKLDVGTDVLPLIEE